MRMRMLTGATDRPRASTRLVVLALGMATVVVAIASLITIGQHHGLRKETSILAAIRVDTSSAAQDLVTVGDNVTEAVALHASSGSTDHDIDTTLPPPPPLNVSVLHPRTVPMPPLQGERHARAAPTIRDENIVETTEYFAQHGRLEPGIHFRLTNDAVLNDPTPQRDHLLLLVVLNDHASYGPNRSSDDLFSLISTFTHPMNRTSLAILTSSTREFQTLKTQLQTRIHAYAQVSLLFRNDFVAQGLTRENRHDDNRQAQRRSMLARYRNFALLSTLQPWHAHVLWLDADVHIVPPTLVTKMIRADRDILEPICYWGAPPSTHEYDRNAWVGRRAVPGSSDSDLRLMSDYRDDPQAFVPLDSVGGTMLYVRADIHRQGVVFAHHYAVGTGWDHDGYDAIETEGLCYSAHFLGYKCWGMPHDPIYHAAS